MADSPFADMDEVTHLFIPGVGKPDGTDNDILDLIKTLHQTQYKEGAYGLDWSSVSLPSNPVDGMTVIRYNTTVDAKRTYRYTTGKGWVADFYRYNISLYLEENLRNADQTWNGIFNSIATAQALSSGSPINITSGISKLFLVLNAGSDFDGTITISGTSVDRDTGVETGSDSEAITIDSLTTENTSTDAEGNNIYDFTTGYITDKWWKGSVTISTTDVNISDMDIYQLAYEQFDDDPFLILDSIDIKMLITNSNAWFYCYTYHVQPNGGKKCDITNLATLSIDVGESTANRNYRLRKVIEQEIYGDTEGVFVEFHFGPPASTYFQNITVKLWAKHFI